MNWKWVKIISTVAVTAVVIYLLLVLSILHVGGTRIEICSRCGSERILQRGLQSWTHPDEIHTTELDHWFADHRGGHVHDWRMLSDVDKNLLGQKVCRYCPGYVPAVYSICGPKMDWYLESMNAEQIAALADGLESPDLWRQKAAVDRVIEERFKLEAK